MLGTSVAAAQSRLVRGRNEIIETMDTRSSSCPTVGSVRPPRTRRVTAGRSEPEARTERRRASKAPQAASRRVNLAAASRGFPRGIFPVGRRCYTVPRARWSPHMAAFGTLTLLIALVVATYAGVASLMGARRRNRRLIESGRAGVYALAAVLGLSSVALVYAFVSHDYSIKYVHHYSDAASPLFYPDHRLLGRAGRLDPVVGFPAVGVLGDRRLRNRHRHRELLPYVVDVLMGDRRLLPVRHRLSQEPVRHLPDRHPDRGQGAEPSAAERVHGHPPAVALYGVRRDEHPVRVRRWRR